jgi:hypothetical protein
MVVVREATVVEEEVSKSERISAVMNKFAHMEANNLYNNWTSFIKILSGV